MNDDDAYQNIQTVDSANPATTTTATTVHNPYANKRPAVTLKDPPKGTPLLFLSSKEPTTVAYSAAVATSDQIRGISNNTPSDIRVQHEDPPSGALAPVKATKATPPPPPPPAGAAATATNVSSTYTPYWERMPSRSLSFGSAEILTVTECLEHAALYHNLSVRVTGLVHRRSFLPGWGPADVIVQLELKDPLQRPTSSNSRSSSLSRGRLSRLPAIRRSSGGIPRTPTSSTTASTNRLSTSSVQLSDTVQNRKRPWFATSSNSKITSSRRRSSLKEATPVNSDGNTRFQPLKATPCGQIKGSVLKVLVDPRLPQLNAIVVGSFVTVIGTIVKIHLDEEDTCAREGGVTGTPQSTQHGIESEGETRKEPTHGSVYKLEARLIQGIRKDFGADMTLLGTALHARRKVMYQRYHHAMVGKTASVHGENPGSTECRPLQGCGPPPYDKLNDDSFGD
jgi:hypothetical protein